MSIHQKTKNKFSFITKNILILSFVSLLTDVASEMLYPIMPLYLMQVGYGVIFIGFVEGFADLVAGIGKYYFGSMSDKINSRNVFVRFGYGVSILSKPLMGISPSFGVIFGARLMDRLGKGIRTAPRDAILATESSQENRGKVFGFHRAMDAFGATLGPIIAIIYLYFYPSHYSSLFLLVLIPGSLAVALTFFLKKEKHRDISTLTPTTESKRESLKSFWKKSPASYRNLIIGLAMLALLNSSDMFLLIRIRELGISDMYIILIYILYNISFTFFALPLGYVGDKFGFKKVFLGGLIVFSLVYGLLARELSTVFIFLVFLSYGFFTAIHEVIGKAWISSYLDPHLQGTGLGLSMMLNSLAFLFASIITGVIWNSFGSVVALSVISLGVIPVIIFFLFLTSSHETCNGKRSLLGCNTRH